MRHFIRRITAFFFVLLLAACGMACTSDKYDFRNAVLTAEADADVLSLYEDGTLVTYTVTAPKQCVKVTLQQHAGGPDDAGDPALLNEQAFTADSEGVSIREDGDNAVWTIPCDFGDNGLDGVRVKAQIPMGEKADYLYADVTVRVEYPSLTADTVFEAYVAFACLNADRPYFFTVAPDDKAAVSEALAALAAGEDFIYPKAGAPVIETAAASDEIAGMFVPEGRLLVKLYIPNDDFALCFENAGVRMPDSARAALALSAGTLPDAALYPVAALLAEKTQQLLSGVPLDTLTPYEQLTALFDLVFNEGRMALTPDDFDTLPDVERAYYDRTAYGLLSGFGGTSHGYADALYLICRAAGLRCVKLPCEEIGGEKDYCVNAVQLDGEWYVADACAATENDMYARFCLNNEKASAFYLWDTDTITITDSGAFAAPAFISDPAAVPAP